MKMSTKMTIPMPGMLLISIAMATLAVAGVAGEKPVGAWADVQKIPAATMVEVVLSDSASLRGGLVSAVEDGLTLRVDSIDRSLSRTGIRCIAVQQRKTGKGAAIGLLVGLALGIPNGFLQGAGAGAGTVAVYTAGGAVIGVLRKGYRTVYRVAEAGPPKR